MHDSALYYAQQFFANYWSDRFTSVAELGKTEGDNSLQQLCPRVVDYLPLNRISEFHSGLCSDLRENVPAPDSSVDVILASSMFQQDSFFWETFLELARILKPGGLLYLNAPSNHHYHPLPLDCWRFYPDAGVSLVKWAKRNNCEMVLAESFVAEPMASGWADYVAVFHKAGLPLIRRGAISDGARAINVRLDDSSEVARMSGYTFENIAQQENSRQISVLTAERMSMERAHQRTAMRLEESISEINALKTQLSRVEKSWAGKLSIGAQKLSEKLKKRYLR